MKLMTVVVLAGCALLAPTTHLTAQAKPAAVEVLDAHVARAPKSKEPDIADKQLVPPGNKGEKGSSMDRPAQRGGVEVRERNGIWEVQVDGKFRGDYHQKEHALAAAALHKLSPR